MSVRSGALSLVATIVLVCGCKADKCKDRPAEVEIRVVPDGALAAKVQGTRVTLNINGGGAVLTHDFPNVSDPQFVFELGEHDQPPHTLVVQVAAYDGSGRTIGTGQEALGFSSDGCNFVTVSVTPETPRDSGTDLLPGDGPARDGDLDAGPTDGLPPDSWPPPDTAPDLLPGDGPGKDGVLDAGPTEGPPPDTWLPPDTAVVCTGAFDENDPGESAYVGTNITRGGFGFKNLGLKPIGIGDGGIVYDPSTVMVEVSCAATSEIIGILEPVEGGAGEVLSIGNATITVLNNWNNISMATLSIDVNALP